MVRSGTRNGFSLIELLVVFSIMAILMGMSIGAFARISQGSILDSTEAAVRAALARSRINARTKAALTLVTIIPADFKKGLPARLRTAWTVSAGSWHFEEETGGKTLGGKNRWATLKGVQRDEDGTVGRCIRFDGGGTVVADPSPDLDPTRGFMLSLDINTEPEIEGSAIFSYGDAFTLSLGEEGSVTAVLLLDLEDQEIHLRSAKGVIEPGAWTRVELGFDGIEAILRVHNVVEARKVVKGLLRAPNRQARLTLGSDDLKGRIDEALYRTMIFEEDEEMDLDIDFKLQSPVTVRFGVDGRLDPRVHTGPVVIPMEMEDQRVTITIQQGGIIR